MLQSHAGLAIQRVPGNGSPFIFFDSILESALGTVEEGKAVLRLVLQLRLYHMNAFSCILEHGTELFSNCRGLLMLILLSVRYA